MPAIASIDPIKKAPAGAVTALVAAGLLGAAPALAADFASFAPFAGLPSGALQAAALDGAPLAIAAEPGKILLVHFFASWCEPCEDELPALAGFVRGRADRIRLIGVDVGEPASRARRFVTRFGLATETALDEDKAVARAFGVRGLPATVAIAPGGGAALAGHGQIDWASPQTAEALSALGQ